MEGKTAVITGATKGIGKAIALKLSSLGANVVINYRSNKTSADELIKSIEQTGRKALAVKADISKYDEAENLIKSAIETFGKIDILVNNAGITKDNLILRMTEEDFDSVIETNLKGVFNCIKHASRPMLRKKQGRIINISSVVGIIGNPGQCNYSASKAGVIGMTKSLAKEFAPRGITVNAVAPGFIQSDMTDKLTEEQKKSYIDAIPTKAFGSVEDVSNAVAFLCSDEANYITGQVINVDGGMVV